MLAFYYPVAFKKDGFLEDENGKFIPKNAIIEAFESATIFYYIKKDKELENLVKKYLLSSKNIKEVSKEVKKRVFDKYDVLSSLEITDKLYVKCIYNELVKVFDLEKKDFVDSFRMQVFKGVIEDAKIKSDKLEKLKTITHSYARALAEYEHKELKGTFLEEKITTIQNQIANEWNIPLRVGFWTLTPFKGDLLFFWRVKEVRDYLLKELKVDIRPKNVLYIPRTEEFLGWGDFSE